MIVMVVQGHAVQAFMRAFLDVGEVAALVAPTDPASAASLSEVDGLVAG